MRKALAIASATFTILFMVTVGASSGQQTGYYVLDGFGGVHAGGGAAAISPQTPYFGFDAAKGIVYIPPGSSGKDGVLVLDAFGGVFAGGAISGASLAPVTPYFGFNVARDIAATDVGVRGWEQRSTGCLTITGNSFTGTSVTCSGSKKVTGGGVTYYSSNTCTTPYVNFATGSRYVTHSGPTAENRWSAGVRNDNSASIFVKFFAMCVNAD